MTPTATVRRMSLTANRPNGGYCEKVSKTMGLVGIIFTIPASPFFKNLGSFSSSLPDRLSILVRISENFTATWEVWQSSNWCISVTNLPRVVHDDDLGGEVGSFPGWVILGVGCNIPTLDILHSNILNVETNVVSWKSLL
ncbi:hypothetical protein LINGRAHAP2_LOCUS14173 [Linum grandiflorum]